jgi:hypothetical protein
MSVIGSQYKQDAASAFSIFRCAQVSYLSYDTVKVRVNFQGLGAAIAFSYAGSLSIRWQMGILVVILFISALASLFMLFDNSSNQLSTFVTVQENEQQYVSYQDSSVYSYG